MEVGLDNQFMLPHLGVLDSIYPEIAWDIFQKFCYLRLGTCIAPDFDIKYGKPAFYIKGNKNIKLIGGDFLRTELDGEYEIIPVRGIKGRPMRKEIYGEN